MVKIKILQRFMPNAEQIKKNKILKIFGKLIDNPHLWHINRRSVAKAFSIGLFITYMPFLGHMFLAAFCAIVFRANLPIALALVWVINPLTMIPMFTVAYMVGALVLGQSLDGLDFSSLSVLQEMWQPFVLGCLICGAILAVISQVLIRLGWRYHIVMKWKKRKLLLPPP